MPTTTTGYMLPRDTAICIHGLNTFKVPIEGSVLLIDDASLCDIERRLIETVGGVPISIEIDHQSERVGNWSYHNKRYYIAK